MSLFDGAIYALMNLYHLSESSYIKAASIQVSHWLEEPHAFLNIVDAAIKYRPLVLIWEDNHYSLNSAYIGHYLFN